MQVFDSHPQMILKKDDFVIFKINWSDKAENIKEIAEELSLGLSSFVFWDDNPIEREQMRVALPEVMVIDCPEEVAEWPNYLQKLTEFSQFQLTAEDLKKSEQYHIRAKFSNEIRTVANKKDYLKSIEMEPKVLSLTEETLDRAVQLCAKTNQFNLRTMRHSRDDLLKLNELGPIGLGSLKDKFGDHGIVGMYVATIQDRRTAFLDTFLLSCRVIGRYFESWLLNQCILSLKNKGVEFLYAEFIDSGKNKVSQNFLNDHHFVNAENGRVVLELNNYKFEQLEVF